MRACADVRPEDGSAGNAADQGFHRPADETVRHVPADRIESDGVADRYRRTVGDLRQARARLRSGFRNRPDLHRVTGLHAHGTRARGRHGAPGDIGVDIAEHDVAGVGAAYAQRSGKHGARAEGLGLGDRSQGGALQRARADPAPRGSLHRTRVDVRLDIPIQFVTRNRRSDADGKRSAQVGRHVRRPGGQTCIIIRRDRQPTRTLGVDRAAFDVGLCLTGNAVERGA